MIHLGPVILSKGEGLEGEREEGEMVVVEEDEEERGKRGVQTPEGR